MNTMTYLDLVNQARIHGISSESKMWASIEQLSKDLESIKTLPMGDGLVGLLLRNQHAILYDRHYSEKFANYDVNALVWSATVPDGSPLGHGPHWSRADIAEATKSMQFQPKVNDWDKYVAFNSMYADLCSEMTDEEILRAAYLFFFCDKDWQPDEDDCTKIWDYTTSHHLLSSSFL